MNDKVTQPMAEGLRQLRTRYLTQLEERIDYLKNHHEIANKNEFNEEERLSLRSLAHKLAGSGSIFGFPHITQAGQALEQALLEGSKSSHNEILSLLTILIDACLAAKNAN
ncbi:MAG: Hpt domain-containing protein [Pseudomonadota bacterium]